MVQIDMIAKIQRSLGSSELLQPLQAYYSKDSEEPWVAPPLFPRYLLHDMRWREPSHVIKLKLPPRAQTSGGAEEDADGVEALLGVAKMEEERLEAEQQLREREFDQSLRDLRENASSRINPKP